MRAARWSAPRCSKLAHEGIVNIEKNRGAFVARPTPADAREVFEARRLIEPTIVDHAVDAVSPAWIERLQQHLAEEREAELRGDARASVRLSGDFHRLVAEMSGHSVYLGFLKELIARSSLIILLYRRHDTPACGTDHHAEIVTAIRRSRQGRAARAQICRIWTRYRGRIVPEGSLPPTSCGSRTCLVPDRAGRVREDSG